MISRTQTINQPRNGRHGEGKGMTSFENVVMCTMRIARSVRTLRDPGVPLQVGVGSRNYLDIPTSGPSSCDDGELFAMPSIPRLKDGLGAANPQWFFGPFFRVILPCARSWRNHLARLESRFDGELFAMPSIPRLKDGLGAANHNSDQNIKPCFLGIIRHRSEAEQEQRPV